MFLKLAFLWLFMFNLPKGLLARELYDKKPNVLFIIVDDLRPQLGCYGHSEIFSPNIDKLSAQGVIFTRSFCQVPMCAPSRVSLLTGLRPTEGRFTDNKCRADEDAPGIIDLPGIFKKNGYFTMSVGKIYHHSADNSQSWDRNYSDEYPEYLPPGLRPDDVTSEVAIRELQRLKKEPKPWFLAIGLEKPHLPFNCPKEYRGIYKREELSLPLNSLLPENAPDEAKSEPGICFKQAYGNGSISNTVSRKIFRGYYACISYIDSLIGKVIKELDVLEMRNDTIVILVGDNGFMLGEHGLWTKFSVFNTALQVPLIISSSSVSKGKTCNALVELLDIYPTLCDLAGIEKPGHLQGVSLVPLLEDSTISWKEAAFSRYLSVDSVKTDKYRYSEWENGARMLYDHRNDPQENINIGEKPENAHVVEYMHKLITGEVISNQAPLANAGEDREIFWPARTVLLKGVVKDDNKPKGAKVTAGWKSMKGPDDVKIIDKGSLSTAVVFKKPGEYILRLYASDTQMVGIDDIKITVKASSSR